MNRLKKPREITKNAFTVRLKNNAVLSALKELFGTRIYGTVGELINRCIEVGADNLYRKLYNGNLYESEGIPAASPSSTPQSAEDIRHALREIKNTTDDVFVVLNLLEYMLTTLYNVTAAKVAGTPVSEDMMRTGLLAAMPEEIEGIKREIVAQYSRKTEEK
jgi:hypothetical protein